MPRKKTKRFSFKLGIFVLVMVFAVGWLAASVFSAFMNTDEKTPFSFGRGNEIESPGDWIKEKQIWVYNDRIIIWVDNPTWGKFTDTNSMDPFIDLGANSIEIKPEFVEDLNVGDVISYESKLVSGIIIHRIVEKNVDEDGVYFITKGDNNRYADPGKIRFEQVKGVVVGVIY